MRIVQGIRVDNVTVSLRLLEPNRWKLPKFAFSLIVTVPVWWSTATVGGFSPAGYSIPAW